MEKSLLLCLLFLSSYIYVSARYDPPKTLVSTVTKNSILPIFSFTLNANEEYFIHIGGPYIVRNCNDGLPRPIVPCGSATCALTRRDNPHQCPPPNNTIINTRCACQATAFEPFQRLCNSNQFTYGDFAISSLNPSCPSVTFSNVYYLCIPKPFLSDFPPGVFGLVGLASTAFAAWNQLYLFCNFPVKCDFKSFPTILKNQNVSDSQGIQLMCVDYLLGSTNVSVESVNTKLLEDLLSFRCSTKHATKFSAPVSLTEFYGDLVPKAYSLRK